VNARHCHIIIIFKGQKTIGTKPDGQLDQTHAIIKTKKLNYHQVSSPFMEWSFSSSPPPPRPSPLSRDLNGGLIELASV